MDDQYRRQIILFYTLHRIECRYNKVKWGQQRMNITDLARDELSKVLQTQEATGVRVYFNGFG